MIDTVLRIDKCAQHNKNKYSKYITYKIINKIINKIIMI